MKTMKRWQFWVGLVLSAIFLYFALRGLGIDEIWEPLKTARYWWLVPGVAVYFIGVWVRSWRWHYLLRPLKSVSTSKMFPIVAIGYMGNNIYPARAGEVLRAVVLKRKEDIPVSASLATVIVERIFDGVVMLGFVFLNLPELVSLTDEAGFIGNIDIRTLTLVGTGLFLSALAVFMLAAMFPTRADKILVWLSEKFLPEKVREKVVGVLQKFLGGLESLRSPREAIMVLVTSIVIWLLETGKYWFVMQAFDFQVSFFALMLMNGIVNLATTIPSAPGYVGTFDAPGIAVLSAYGVDQGVAAGYTLVLHAALWLPITVLGAYFMLREGIRWQGGKVVEQKAAGDEVD
jgi:uncharacterized protein (TIRG00374 family)